MVEDEGVLLDVSNAGEEAYRRIVEFANSTQGLMWNSDFEESSGAGGAGGGGGWTGRKKLVVVKPTTVEALTAFVESIV